jgi:ankyrin repeat protein
MAIAKCLIEAGANLLQTDYHGFSVLHFAVMWGWKETVELILDKTGEALLNGTTMFGRTPLHFAVEFGHTDAVKLLLARDAMVNAPDREGITPLLCACEAGSFEMAKLLLEHDADVTVISSKGKTTLKLACEHNNEDLVNLLLDHKVKRRGSAFSLLQNDVYERISQRLIREEEEARAAAKAAEEEAKRQAAVTAEVNLVTRGYSHRSPYGQWVPYKDKRTKKVFFYNKVSRVSQWDRPPDYVHDATYLKKEATFGMSFYR